MHQVNRGGAASEYPHSQYASRWWWSQHVYGWVLLWCLLLRVTWDEGRESRSDGSWTREDGWVLCFGEVSTLWMLLCEDLLVETPTAATRRDDLENVAGGLLFLLRTRPLLPPSSRMARST